MRNVNNLSCGMGRNKAKHLEEFQDNQLEFPVMRGVHCATLIFADIISRPRPYELFIEK